MEKTNLSRALLIRETDLADINSLPAIERSAGAAFRQYPRLSWLADGEVMSADEHARLVTLGYCWVAERTEERSSDASRLCGFLSAEPVAESCSESGSESRQPLMSEATTLHIWELAVSADAQRSGAGSALMRHAIALVNNDSRLTSLTLTTFREVAFNAPFYKRLGFEVLEDSAAVERQRPNERLRQVLAAEAAHGLPSEDRCAMRYECC